MAVVRGVTTAVVTKKKTRVGTTKAAAREQPPKPQPLPTHKSA